MPKPTIELVVKDDRPVWLVQYGGMARHFPESKDWAAQQFFELVSAAYSSIADSQASSSAM
jgi:cellulase/cellobiase CelA1